MHIQNRVDKRHEIEAYNQNLKLNLPVFVIMLKQFLLLLLTVVAKPPLLLHLLLFSFFFFFLFFFSFPEMCIGFDGNRIDANQGK